MAIGKSYYGGLHYDPRRDRYVGGREEQLAEAYQRGLVSAAEVDLAMRGMMTLDEIVQRRTAGAQHDRMKKMAAYYVSKEKTSYAEERGHREPTPFEWLDGHIKKVTRLAR